MHGVGMYCYPNEDRMEGHWCKKKEHGQFRVEFANTLKWEEGSYVDGQRHGEWIVNCFEKINC